MVLPMPQMKTAVTFALLLLVACGGKSMDPPAGSGSSTAGDTSLPGNSACEVPAGVSTTETDDGCYATMLSGTFNGTPRSLCSANQFGLICQGPSENATGSPGPAPALGCAAVGLPLPLNVFEYCCPCASGGNGGGSGSPGDAGPSGSGFTCTSGSGGGGSYTLQASETSSDGTTYQVACTCPAATCTCAEASGQSGGGGGGVAFSACAESCSSAGVSAAYEACGFPH
jgi:hypothetical protein